MQWREARKPLKRGCTADARRAPAPKSACSLAASLLRLSVVCGRLKRHCLLKPLDAATTDQKDQLLRVLQAEAWTLQASFCLSQ